LGKETQPFPQILPLREAVSQLEIGSVIPAEAGIPSRFYSRFDPLDARLRGHDEL